MAEKFQWYGEDAAESVIIQSVQAVAVYTNPNGEIVIRQESSTQDDDHFVVIPRSQVKVLLKALRDEAAKPFTPEK
jgi:hypothetical protein